jgi:DNA-binding NtrC family response regulator
MYRLRVIPIFLPALRERREDIALLCTKIIETSNATARRKIERVSPSALHLLQHHDWPGNIRELRNVLTYAYAVGDGPILQAHELPPELLHDALRSRRADDDAAELSANASPEARRLLDALAKASGNKSRAAQILGISRVTLWRHLRELGFEAGVSPPA